LVLLMIPVVVRSTEEMLKLVPNELREGVVRARGAQVEDHRASSCCRPPSRGSSPASCSAWPGSWARPLRCSSSGPYTKSIATNLFDGYMATLPTMINQDRTEAAWTAAIDRVWGAALTLILIVLVLNLARAAGPLQQAPDPRR
jgi:phosphate transport system permease protein